MYRPARTITVLACVGLTASQLSGLHMHVNANGYAGTPQGTHVHSQGNAHRHGDAPADHGATHGHEHEGDRSHDGDKDVSITELSIGTSKLVILPLWTALGQLIPARLDQQLAPYAAVPRPIGRHDRWRPPQRAPPRPS